MPRCGGALIQSWSRFAAGTRSPECFRTLSSVPGSRHAAAVKSPETVELPDNVRGWRSIRWKSWLMGIVTVLGLWWIDVALTKPPFPSPLNLRLSFPVGVPGRGEAILATGTVDR